MTFITLDPAKTATGWAVFMNDQLADSGTIRPRKRDGHFLTSIEKQLKAVLAQYQPQKAWLEKQYKYARCYRNKQGRRVMTVGGSQAYAAAWEQVNKVISDWGIPCEYLDTTKLARNKVAIAAARNYTNKKMGEDESECVVWGYYLIDKGRV